jgi:hypothetical protein
VFCYGGVRRFCSGYQALVAPQCLKLPRLSAHATACRGMLCGVQGSEEVWDAVRRVSTRVLLVGRCVSCTPVTKARHMFVRTLLRNPREHCFPSSPVNRSGGAGSEGVHLLSGSICPGSVPAGGVCRTLTCPLWHGMEPSLLRFDPSKSGVEAFSYSVVHACALGTLVMSATKS